MLDADAETQNCYRAMPTNSTGGGFFSSNHASRGWGFPQGSELASAFGRQAKKSRKSDGAKVTGVFAS